WPDWVKLAPNRYVATTDDRRGPGFVSLALWLYWALGGFRRGAPTRGRAFPGDHLFKRDRIVDTLLYEEARVAPSDARFVAHWILPWNGPGQIALNYCEVTGGGRDGAA